jgi:hypothetical protein
MTHVHVQGAGEQSVGAVLNMQGSGGNLPGAGQAALTADNVQ